jgi:DNA-binding IclR family transcriptional regulator
LFVANGADDSEEVNEATRGRVSVKSADRVLTLFELLGRWGCEMSHTEIADLMGIPKSSLSQLLKNLVGRGWLGYSPDTRKYLLGPAFVDLARGAAHAQDVVALSGPVLTELAAATNETAALNVLRGDKAETVATALGSETLLAVMRLGQRAPLYTTSYGKVLLAYLPEDMQEDYLRRVKLVPVTAKSIVSRKLLRSQLQEVRRDGVAYSFEEQVPGIIGTARPIFASNGNVVGAISIASAAIRYDKRRGAQISQAIAQAVTKLSQQLRHLRVVPEAPPARRRMTVREKV